MTQVASARLGVGVLVRHGRERRGVSQRTLSGEVKRSPAYISKLESGDLDPSLRAFSAVAVALGMTALEIWTIVQLEAAADSEAREGVTPPRHDTYHGEHHE
jgi:ribosome-binding protein aMBF1 (putative translation factor)